MCIFTAALELNWEDKPHQDNLDPPPLLRGPNWSLAGTDALPNKSYTITSNIGPATHATLISHTVVYDRVGGKLALSKQWCLPNVYVWSLVAWKWQVDHLGLGGSFHQEGLWSCIGNMCLSREAQARSMARTHLLCVYSI
jgi:hypothetical protein